MKTRSRPDRWTIQAKALGYPARSVFKIEEIQKKWNVFRLGQSILDIGAAPGSWTLYALRRGGPSCSVSAVDLNPLEIRVPQGARFQFFQGDVFTDEAERFLRGAGPYGCVLSDAAPATSGNRISDARRSFDLVMRVIDLAEQLLAEGGNLVVKVFQGGDEREIRDRLRGLFQTVKVFRPAAVRDESMEVYMIGRGFGGPGGPGAH